MAYRRSSSRRAAPARRRSVSGYSRVRSGGPVRARRPAARRRSSGGGGTRTVRLVIEQAAPSIAPVVGENGAFQVPDGAGPLKRAKF